MNKKQDRGRLLVSYYPFASLLNPTLVRKTWQFFDISLQQKKNREKLIFQSCENDLSFPIEKPSGIRRGDFDDYDEYYYDDEEEYEDYQEYFFEKRPKTKPNKKAPIETIERFEPETEDNIKSSLSWKSSSTLAKDIMGSLAYAGQAVFAPWTLPGQKFSVKGPHPRIRAVSDED